MARVADRLLRLRQRHGGSQETVAEVVGVTQAAISRWENPEHPATPSAAELAALATHFGVTCDYLVGSSEHEDELPAGQALLDEGLLEALLQVRNKRELAALIGDDLAFGIYATIPERATVVSHAEAQRRLRQVDKHLRAIDEKLWREWARQVLG